MIELEVYGWRTLCLEHLVLDVNGTVSLDGMLLPGVLERAQALQRVLQIHLLSADTYGRLDTVAAELGVSATRVHRGESESEQKARFVQALRPTTVVAIGSGANDMAMLREAGLGIVVLGKEGLASEALVAADVVAASIQDALDLLLNPKRIVATLRR